MDRAILVLEVAIGVAPITIVGGVYSLLGLYFSAGALIASVWARSVNAVPVFLKIFGLAAGGLAGIVGLWAVVLISASRRPPSAQLSRAALYGSAIGIITAVIAVILMIHGSVASPWPMAVVLGPVFVVLHRAPAILRRQRASEP